MKVCPECKFENADSYLFCMQCGAKLGVTGAETAYIPEENNSEEDVPKTRIAKSLSDLMENESEEGARTQLFQSKETRINPQLIRINDDGSESEKYDITRVNTTIGRSQGEITFPTDTYMSPEHAVLVFDDGKLSVEDLDSFNGVYVKITKREQIKAGAYILVGQQLLQFFPFKREDLKIPPKPDSKDIINFYGISNKTIIGMLKQLYADRSEGNRYYFKKTPLIIGRQSGDIIFTEDKFMSNSHAVIEKENDYFFITDNGSSNGVFLQINEKTELSDEDQILIGKQLFKYRAPTD